MNLTYKKPVLYVAVAAAMGIIPTTILAGTQTPLNGGTPRNQASAPLYYSTEAKESSTTFATFYDNTWEADGTQVAADSDIAATSKLYVAGSLDAYVYIKPSYVVKAAEGKQLIVKVSLTSGATFVKTPSLICMHSGGGTQVAAGITALNWAGVQPTLDPMTNDTTVTAYRINPSQTVAGKSTYNFVFPEGFATQAENHGSGACILSIGTGGNPYPIVDADAVSVPAIKVTTPGTNVSLNVEVSYDSFFNTIVDKASALPMITFVTGYKAEFSKTNPVAAANTNDPYANAVPMIDVAASSKKFTSGRLHAFAGYLIVTAIDGSRTLRNASGWGLSAGNVLTSAAITITGPTIATLSKVTLNSASTTEANGGNKCNANVEAEGVPAAVSGGLANSVTIGVDQTMGAYSAIVSATTTNHKGALVCLIAGGTSIMQDGYVTLSVVGTSYGKSVELGNTAADFSLVKRNGAVVRVLNIPGATPAADPYRVNIRMFNTSSQDVTNIKGTIYGVDGKEIATDILLADKLPQNGMKLITSDTLISLVGKNWEGRAWMVIQAPVDKSFFKVQVLVKQPSGVLANISTDATD